MIHTDGRPTLANAPGRRGEVINDGRDPGDEHYERSDPRKGTLGFQRTRPWTVEGTDSGNGTPDTEDE